MQIEFTIPYPKTKAGKRQWAKEYGLNAIYAGKHWSRRKKDSEYWHALVHNELRRQRIRSTPFEKRVEIAMFWNDNLDIDNHAYMGKMIVDALKGKIIQDDRKRYFKRLIHDEHKRDVILVRVRELEE